MGKKYYICQKSVGLQWGSLELLNKQGQKKIMASKMVSTPGEKKKDYLIETVLMTPLTGFVLGD